MTVCTTWMWVSGTLGNTGRRTCDMVHREEPLERRQICWDLDKQVDLEWKEA